MKRIFLGLLITCGFAGTAIGQETVDFAKYMQSSQALSAIASAVDSAGACSVPLEFDEHRQDGQLVLGIYCRGGEEDESAIFITFMDLGTTLLPLKYDYAG